MKKSKLEKRIKTICKRRLNGDNVPFEDLVLTRTFFSERYEKGCSLNKEVPDEIAEKRIEKSYLRNGWTEKGFRVRS